MIHQWTALAEIRNLLGITKAEVAVRLGVNGSSVARKEAGIPALSDDYIPQICAMLSVNEAFLSGKTSYPFLPNSFSIFHVKGLKNRISPLGWLNLLITYSENIKLLLLLRRKSDNVVAACVKDDKDSVFLISVEIPLLFKTVFEYIGKQAEGKVRVTEKECFDSPNIASPHTFSDIAHYSRDLVESMIEDAFADVLSDKEKELVKFIRGKNVPIEKMIDYAKKTKK
ncbi:MAG: helix-turn-helix domain-containing protein [Thermodesulfovibrionales bacterium]